jgi:uncharacterized protein (DUF1800 family)
VTSHAAGPRRLASCLLAGLLASPAFGAVALAGVVEDDASIVQVLNRAGFGPRPGDLERLRRTGIEAWVEDQLHPERFPERALEPRLGGLDTLRLDSRSLMAGYDIPPAVRRALQRKRAELGENPSEEELRRARRALLAGYRQRMDGMPREVLEDLQAAKLLRATYAEAQLRELLTDFWMNHFNVYARKGPERYLLGEYERDVIRPRVLGSFEELLRASAESPAMLFYLDNWLSTAEAPARPGRPFGRRGRRLRDRADQARPRRPRGLNENYARELLELHSLGVDGGYTQRDVTEVARCFSGWTIRGLRQQRPEFVFAARLHDPGDKLVLGHRIAGGGKDEGDAVIHLLASHPATARFISRKLARRFVSDQPPEALVERASQTFRRTQGDLRAVVATILKAPEFLAPEARNAKLKTPFELVVSALRASGAEVKDARELNRRLAAMGMPLYLQQPPTGYKDSAGTWASSAGLLARLNFALDLARGAILGVQVDPSRLDPRRLVPGGLSAVTLQTLDVEGAGLGPAQAAGLVLGSPEFQRR